MIKKPQPIHDSTIEMAPVLTVRNVAEYLHVHPSTIYRLVKKRQLPAFRVGSDWRFNRESIDRWRADAEHSQAPVNHSPDNSGVGAAE
jgi:excisionase family DNA binding protein